MAEYRMVEQASLIWFGAEWLGERWNGYLSMVGRGMIELE
jgi:hypothetical protein